MAFSMRRVCPSDSFSAFGELDEVVDEFLGREFLVGHGAKLRKGNIGLCRVSTGQDDSVTALTGAE